MLRHALKEWAVICRALAEGRQAVLLRAGGIAEEGGAFRVEQRRFWLYPTFAHQHRDGIKPEAVPLLEQAEAGRPPEGVVRLNLFAEVGGIYLVHDIASVLKLSPFHLWSDQAARDRFHYRQPGLYVLPVRVYRCAGAVELPESSGFAGCKSWVDLERDLPTENAAPAIDDDSFRRLMRALDDLLQPTAFA